MKKLVLIKYGGHAMDDPELKDFFCNALSSLVSERQNLIIVHGGGPQINSTLRRLSIESNFVDGLRVTDQQTMQAVEMALCGTVNKLLVRDFARKGVSAVGISGQDGALLRAKIKNPDLGLVGEIEKVNPRLVRCLLDANFVPVIAPLAMGANGEALNVNADSAAGALAGALEADYFVLISDVPGVLDNNGILIPELDSKAIFELRASQVITGGMIPKLEACMDALAKGCKESVILDGRKPNAVGRFLRGEEAFGTRIRL